MKLHSSKSVLYTVAAVVLTFGLAACGGSGGNGNGPNEGGLTPADFENWCSEAKSCVGEQSFNRDYDSVEDCASDQFDTFKADKDQCGAAAQNYYECMIQNFQCVQGTLLPDPSACQEEVDEFGMQCGVPQ